MSTLLIEPFILDYHTYVYLAIGLGMLISLLFSETVGVMGDNRTYEYLCLLRAITSEDGMTADFYEFKKSFMETISNQIVNNIRGINRVVYDITSKPPSTIELE